MSVYFLHKPIPYSLYLEKKTRAYLGMEFQKRNWNQVLASLRSHISQKFIAAGSSQPSHQTM